MGLQRAGVLAGLVARSALPEPSRCSSELQSGGKLKNSSWIWEWVLQPSEADFTGCLGGGGWGESRFDAEERGASQSGLLRAVLGEAGEAPGVRPVMLWSNG